MASSTRSRDEPHPVASPDGGDLDPLVVGPAASGGSGPPRPGVPWWADGTESLRQRWGPGVSPARLAAAAAVAAVLVAGGWWLLRPAAPPVETILPVATDAGGSTPVGSGAGAVPGGSAPPAPYGAAATGSSTAVASELVVQAAGAVARPGVYRLPGDGRVDDLVRAAGGLTADADADRVNLAGPLVDGERVWVPKRGQTEIPEVVAGGARPTSPNPGPGGPAVGTGPNSSEVVGPVDLNTATADQLDTLPGVGPATAQSILAYREEHERFTSVDELLDVRGIGDAKLEQLRPLVAV